MYRRNALLAIVLPLFQPPPISACAVEFVVLGVLCNPKPETMRVRCCPSDVIRTLSYGVRRLSFSGELVRDSALALILSFPQQAPIQAVQLSERRWV